MAGKMKVKKGDLVQILTGKDRGKRGRVIEARPSEQRVIVENLNVAKRHTRPRPIRDSSRMGRGRVCRLATLRFSTITRCSDGRASMTRPRFPRSLPVRIWTRSPFFTFILVAMSVREPLERG